MCKKDKSFLVAVRERLLNKDYRKKGLVVLTEVEMWKKNEGALETKKWSSGLRHTWSNSPLTATSLTSRPRRPSSSDACVSVNGRSLSPSSFRPRPVVFPLSLFPRRSAFQHVQPLCQRRRRRGEKNDRFSLDTCVEPRARRAASVLLTRRPCRRQRRRAER